jgi:hypothetical protein
MLEDLESDGLTTDLNENGRCYWQSIVLQKNAVFWDGTPRGSCNNRRFEVT